MTFAAVMMHKYWVREVAASAPADVDSGLAAAVYDELVRRVSLRRCVRLSECMFACLLCIRQDWADKSVSRASVGERELKHEVSKLNVVQRDKALVRARQFASQEASFAEKPRLPIRGTKAGGSHVPAKRTAEEPTRAPQTKLHKSGPAPAAPRVPAASTTTPDYGKVSCGQLVEGYAVYRRGQLVDASWMHVRRR